VRGAIAGLPTPHALADTLPTMLRDDPTARALCSGLDEVLAPVLATLDSFPAYLDLATTPPDVIPWLGQWLGIAVDAAGDLAQSRALLAHAAELQTQGGTAAGIAGAVEAAYGVSVDVQESGAASWSTSPGGALPGEPRAALVVTLHPSAGQAVDTDRIDALVARLKPAHVHHRLQVADDLTP
jgi:phage tail-like protein